jgi:hypothetical protein
MQRTKGAAAEREVAGILRDHGWPNARRTSDGREQIARGDIAGGPQGCHVEVKRQERLNVPAALDQVRRDADPLDVPLLIHRPSRAAWMVTLPLEELLPLLALRERG